MDSAFEQTLFQLFDGIAEWRRKLDLVQEEVIIPWSESHVSVVYGYILRLGYINSEFKLLKKLLSVEDLYFSREIVVSFLQELREFFVVPKLQELYVQDNAGALKKHEVLAVFINFLLQLLSCKTDFVYPFEDRIDRVKDELRSLVTILGDASLLFDEVEQVNDLLAEFESVANEAGSFVYSFIFTMDGVFIVTRMDDAITALLSYINHLRDNITNLSFLLPCISKTNITAQGTAVDPLFIVDSLLHDLEDLMNRKHNLIVDVKIYIKLLRQQLMLSQSFLKDINVPRYSDIEELKGPVMQSRDLAYKAEYLVNSFLVGDVPQDYLAIRLPDITHKIKLVGIEFQEIKKAYDTGALKPTKSFGVDQSLQDDRNFKVDNITVGLEDDTICILDHLLGGTENLHIITIFGMSGLGKTTLAKKLYNHPFISYYFDRRSWCVVSQTYLRKNLLIGILISVESELDKVKILDMEEESLGEHIYKSLKGRRYLMVMDDVWDLNSWNDFRRYFPNDGNGSRILFTSRNKNWTPPNSIIYELPPLSYDHSWELLKKKVFHDKLCPPQLLGVGKKIAQNCKGLPLSIVVVAGILSIIEKEESAWEDVGESLTSYILSHQKNFTMQILELSYKHLPDHLKTCFLYFGTFPEDAEISVKKLKCLWIAEGFICKKENKSAEIVAEEYLMELIDRSLVIVAKRRSDGGAKACVVHDLLRDFCLKIAEEQNFLKIMENNYSIYTKQHRLCVHMKLNPMTSSEFMLPFGPHVHSFFGHFQDEDSPLCVLNMKLLKVLNLPRNKLGHSDGITFLFHLRYLAIQYVPISVSSLVNLEFLIVSQILGGRLSISKMVKLRCLISDVLLLEKDSNSYKTNNLEFLSTLYIQKVEDEEMLKCSPHLRKLKCRCKHFLDQQGVYRCPDFSFFNQLESLNITSEDDECYDIRILYQLMSLDITSLEREDLAIYVLSEKCLDQIYHNSHGSRTEYLEADLSLDKYIESLKRAALIEAVWTKIKLPSNIKKLTLNGLWLPWPKISIIGGLPNLQVLKLGNEAFVGQRWDTSDGEFQNLKFLKLSSIFITEWNVGSSEHFPRLQRLVLWYCYNLKEIPCEIGEITTLQLVEVKSGKNSLAESATKIQQEQLEMGNEDLNVIIAK